MQPSLRLQLGDNRLRVGPIASKAEFEAAVADMPRDRHVAVLVQRNGTTVFVPAGVAHAYIATDDARYLIVLTERLRALIDELHTVPIGEHAAVFRRYSSELLE